MNKDELAAYLQGKTIASAKTFYYMGWVGIESVTFDNGAALELFGSAGVAQVTSLRRERDGNIEFIGVGEREPDDIGTRMIERWRDSDNPGTVLFFSEDGDDSNDGLAPETAKKTFGSISFDSEPEEITIYLPE